MVRVNSRKLWPSNDPRHPQGGGERVPLFRQAQGGGEGFPYQVGAFAPF